MKSSAQIQGLPIFSLIDGAEIGHVKHLVIEPSSGSVRLFQVENDQQAIGVSVLPYTSVIGVGDFAVTVESGESIRDLSSVEGARDLVLLSYKIIGTRVLSRKGQLMGTVQEYYVDEESGSVTACSYLEHGAADSTRVFHRDNIMTFGRDVLVIKDEARIYASLDEEPASAQDNVIQHPASHEATRAAQESAVTAERDAASPQAASTEPDGTETGSVHTDDASASADTVDAGSDHAANQSAASGPYAYLIGKRLTSDLKADNGDLIASSGTVVTAELIERVKAAGPTLFMKLNRLT